MDPIFCQFFRWLHHGNGLSVMKLVGFVECLLRRAALNVKHLVMNVPWYVCLVFFP